VLTRNRILAPMVAALLSVMTAGSLHAQSAAVICKDGKTSVSARGACSSHGGVASRTVSRQTIVRRGTTPAMALARPPVTRTVVVPRASARAVERANVNSAVRRSVAINNNNPRGAIARCKDGLYSHAATRRAACAYHGGVARWM
jgi:hypothetical protein